MSMAVLKLPDVQSEAEARPQRCPSCQGETFQRWGGRRREIRDPQVHDVMVYRYRCCQCRHTFRHDPAGGLGTAEPAAAQVGGVDVGVGVELLWDRNPASRLWYQHWADEQA